MKYIVEYKLHAGQIPYFIEDGGYFPIGSKLIGITKDSSDCFIPKLASDGGDLVALTNQQLIDRAASFSEDPQRKIELQAEAEAWLSAKGF